MSTTEKQYHEVILYEYFGEYLGMLHDHKWRPGFARSFLVIDFSHAQDVGLKVDTSELPQHVKDMRGGFIDGAEMDGGYLFLVSGKIEDHKSLFCEMVQELIEGPQGADDDTFDYWPGAMETLEMYAKELFELSNDYFYYEQLVEVATKNKDVMEWEESAERIVELYEVRT
jgi:hypothetical protein